MIAHNVMEVAQYTHDFALERWRTFQQAFGGSWEQFRRASLGDKAGMLATAGVLAVETVGNGPILLAAGTWALTHTDANVWLTAGVTGAASAAIQTVFCATALYAVERSKPVLDVVRRSFVKQQAIEPEIVETGDQALNRFRRNRAGGKIAELLPAVTRFPGVIRELGRVGDALALGASVLALARNARREVTFGENIKQSARDIGTIAVANAIIAAGVAFGIDVGASSTAKPAVDWFVERLMDPHTYEIYFGLRILAGAAGSYVRGIRPWRQARLAEPRP